MKKVLSLILCFVLLTSFGFSALAADKTDSSVSDRLEVVSQKVKNALGISDSFTSFNGSLNETGPYSLWMLSWVSDKEQIFVQANEDGTIVSYNDNFMSGIMPPYERIPRFPTLSADDAKAAAEAFLPKVLDTKTASVDLAGNCMLDYTGSAVYYLNGPLKLYGVETPVIIGITVGASKQVMNYYRSDQGQDYSGVTNPSSAIDKAAAAATLKSKLIMKPVYRLPGDGTHSARLQYQPNPDSNPVIDATNGTVVDLAKLDYGNEPYFPYAAAQGSIGYGTVYAMATVAPVEQSSIDKMQGALSRSELEKKVRAYPELGLTSDFTVQNVSYSSYEDDQKQTRFMASMQFICIPNSNMPQYVSVSLDAKTGKVMSVYSSYGMQSGAQATGSTYSKAQTEAVARSFAGRILPDEMSQTVPANNLYKQPNMDTYTFNRTHDSIPFPENAVYVAVDPKTGFIASFYYNWYDFDVTFAPSSNMITADAAAAKYSEGAGTALRYVSVPSSLQTSRLLLAYTAADTSIIGVDAVTGELQKAPAAPNIGLKYDDTDGNPYAAVINKLASFGIGFPGSAFKPDEQLTQQDALTLIESTNGRPVFSSAAISGPGDIYTMAYTMGILTPDEKDPTRLLTRAEFVKYLVNALGYSGVAKLSGIFNTGFKDDSAIPAELEGYVAIAKGFGIIKGDPDGNFRPNETATRVQAAIMLFNCMSRK